MNKCIVSCFVPLVGCATHQMGGQPCEEAATTIALGATSSVGLSAQEAVASFPTDWDVTWEGMDGGAPPPPDVVELTLTAVDAEDVVSESDDEGSCHPYGTKFLRIGVVGTFSTADGLMVGDLSGWIELEDGDVDDWQFLLDAVELVLTGDDLALAQQAVQDHSDVETLEGYSASFARMMRWVDEPIRLGVDAHGRTADQSSITSGLWYGSTISAR